MTPNASSQTVSSSPRLRKQEVYAGYKKNRRWWGNRSAVGLVHECFCGLKFSTQQARDRHLQNCHEPKDAE